MRDAPLDESGNNLWLGGVLQHFRLLFLKRMMKHRRSFSRDWLGAFSCHTCVNSEGLFKVYTLSSRILYECSDLIDFGF